MGSTVLTGIFEIDPLFLYDQGPVHDTLIDIQHIFPEKSNEEKLHRSKDSDHDKYGCHACYKSVPPDKLHDEIDKTYDKA